jgi:uncharacterized protein with HEPN domain
MPHDPRKLLEDMRLAAVDVQEFTSGQTEATYLDDRLLRSAVERQFEILAEALNRLLKQSPDIATRITDYRRIINFRNVLSHVYDEVDDQIVWRAVRDDLPVLLREVEELLASLGDE